MDRTPVAGQHPLESVVEQPLHRGNLLAPGVPAGTPEGIKMAARLAPGQVIAGEEKRVAVEEDGVPFRVTGRRDHEQVIVDRDGGEAGWLTLNGGCPGADIVAVQHTRAAEALVELLVVGHVVLMRQEHRLHAAERGDVLHQRRGETRRVDEHVAVPLASFTPNQVAKCAEGALRREATAVDTVFDQFRVTGDGRRDIALAHVADRRCRTGDESLLGGQQLFVRLRLMKDGRLIANVMKYRWRDLAAGVAIDAGRVDEEVALDVGGRAQRSFCHGRGNGSVCTEISGRDRLPRRRLSAVCAGSSRWEKEPLLPSAFCLLTSKAG